MANNNTGRRIFYIGARFINKHGTTVELVENQGYVKSLYKVLGSDIFISINNSAAKRGDFKTPICTTVYGVGYLGEGPYVCRIDGKRMSPAYSHWSNMLRRCYTNYTSDSRDRTYKGRASVAKEWHNFQTFADWFYESHYKIADYKGKYCIDKDLFGINSADSAVYSKETCCLLPNSINCTLFGDRITSSNLGAGVSRLKSGKFKSVVMEEGKQIPLGLFDTATEAVEARKSRKRYRLKQQAEEHKNILSTRVYNKLIGADSYG